MCSIDNRIIAVICRPTASVEYTHSLPRAGNYKKELIR